MLSQKGGEKNLKGFSDGNFRLIFNLGQALNEQFSEHFQDSRSNIAFRGWFKHQRLDYEEKVKSRMP